MVDLYTESIQQLMKIVSSETLDIRKNLISRDCMSDLSTLVKRTFGKYLTPLLITCHTMKHMTK